MLYGRKAWINLSLPGWYFKTKKILLLKSRAISSDPSLSNLGNEILPRMGRNGLTKKKGRAEENTFGPLLSITLCLCLLWLIYFHSPLVPRTVALKVQVCFLRIFLRVLLLYHFLCSQWLSFWSEHCNFVLRLGILISARSRWYKKSIFLRTERLIYGQRLDLW